MRDERKTWLDAPIGKLFQRYLQASAEAWERERESSSKPIESSDQELVLQSYFDQESEAWVAFNDGMTRLSELFWWRDRNAEPGIDGEEVKSRDWSAADLSDAPGEVLLTLIQTYRCYLMVCRREGLEIAGAVMRKHDALAFELARRAGLGPAGEAAEVPDAG